MENNSVVATILKDAMISIRSAESERISKENSHMFECQSSIQRPINAQKDPDEIKIEKIRAKNYRNQRDIEESRYFQLQKGVFQL